MSLPDQFCWTRFGTEAAQTIHQILDRKEHERLANGGMFLWGIGNAVGPSMKKLVRLTHTPEVLFSPIKSGARAEDSTPPSVAVWTSAETLFGNLFRLPDHTLVTSRYDPANPRGSHYALVCFSDQPLKITSCDDQIVMKQLRNLLSGRPVGASQVTAIVHQAPAERNDQRAYEVSIRARLIDPFLIRLQDPLPLGSSIDGSICEQSWSDAVRRHRDRPSAAASKQLGGL